jgi:hypothetical protein
MTVSEPGSLLPELSQLLQFRSYSTSDPGFDGSYEPDHRLFDFVLSSLSDIPHSGYLFAKSNTVIDLKTGEVVWDLLPEHFWQPPAAYREGEDFSIRRVEKELRVRPEVEAAIVYHAYLQESGLCLSKESKAVAACLLSGLKIPEFEAGDLDGPCQAFELEAEVVLPLAKKSPSFSWPAYLVGAVRGLLFERLVGLIAMRSEKTEPPAEYRRAVDSGPWRVYFGNRPGRVYLRGLSPRWSFRGDTEVLSVRTTAYAQLGDVWVSDR